jgi:hypothetical protein
VVRSEISVDGCVVCPAALPAWVKADYLHPASGREARQRPSEREARQRLLLVPLPIPMLRQSSELS